MIPEVRIIRSTFFFLQVFSFLLAVAGRSGSATESGRAFLLLLYFFSPPAKPNKQTANNCTWPHTLYSLFPTGHHKPKQKEGVQQRKASEQAEQATKPSQ